MCTPRHHLIFTMCELVLKDKATLLVWNNFGFQAGEDGKPITSEKANCCIVSEACVSKGQEYV